MIRAGGVPSRHPFLEISEGDDVNGGRHSLRIPSTSHKNEWYYFRKTDVEKKKRKLDGYDEDGRA